MPYRTYNPAPFNGLAANSRVLPQVASLLLTISLTFYVAGAAFILKFILPDGALTARLMLFLLLLCFFVALGGVAFTLREYRVLQVSRRVVYRC